MGKISRLVGFLLKKNISKTVLDTYTKERTLVLVSEGSYSENINQNTDSCEME